jgi:hypothetical protein
MDAVHPEHRDDESRKNGSLGIAESMHPNSRNRYSECAAAMIAPLH